MTKTEVEKYFYPRPPRGGRPTEDSLSHFTSIFLSTPSARRATFIKMVGADFNLFLSTPSARRATKPPALLATNSWISIHALREEGDLQTIGNKRQMKNFYPRPPRGGRPVYKPAGSVAFAISIHALREEGDQRPPRSTPSASRFLSTPSARRATTLGGETTKADAISIHALREEGD